MKHYRHDPNAPSHLRKLVDSARIDNLDAVKRRAVAKRLGIASTLGLPEEPSLESSRIRTPTRESLGGIALTVIALVGGTATYVAVSRPSPTRSAVVSPPVATLPPTSTVEPAPAPETPSVSVTTLLDAPKPAFNSPVEHASAAKPTASTEPATKGGDLRLEVAALDRVRRTTEDGRPLDALALLDEYVAKFPKGQLREEALALRIEALQANGDQAGAERLAEQLLRSSPDTPYAARVRAALAPATPDQQ